MPEQIPPVVEPVAPVDQAKANAEIAAKVAAQDIMGQSNSANPAGDAGSALDALAKQHDEDAKKAAEAAAAAPEVPAEETPEAKATREADEAAAAKVAADKAAADAANPALDKAKDLFKDTPNLPPGASPKSSEAFATVKLKAAQEIAARETELGKLRDELAAIKKQAGQPTTEQLEKEKELEDHRAWRAKLDVDFDPKFKEFDKTVEQNREFIYAQLKKSPMVTDAIIEQIKKFGGPDKTNMSKLFESIGDPTIQRVIESKVSDILMADYAKTQAINKAKENLTQYLADREGQAKSSATAHVSATKAALDSMIPNLSWFKDESPKADADPAEKTRVQEHNQFVGQLREQLNDALTDDSPQMRAVLITGMAQLFHTQRVNASLTAKLASTEKTLTELQAKHAKVVSASRSRLNESNAPTNTPPPQVKTNQFTTPAGDALDSIAKQVMEERQRKAEGAR